MRVLHVISGIDRRHGGVAAAMLGMAAAQAKAGLAVTVFSTFPANSDNTAAAELRDAGVTVTLLGPTAGRLLNRHPETPAVARRLVKDADIVHIHGLWEDVQHQTMVAAGAADKPYVVTAHGMLTEWALKQKALKKRIYLSLRLRRDLRQAACMHFATDGEARQADQLQLGVPTFVEPHGIDLTEFAELPPPGAFREKHPEIGGRTLVTFMGRLHPVKGLDLLIPAFATAFEKSDRDDYRLVLAGPDEGGYGAKVREMIDLHGMTGRVLLPGMLFGRDRIAALADADLFVLPSYLENFGIVALEALAAKTPIILSNQVNFGEHVLDQPFAQIVPCEVPALAAALTSWLNDPARRSRESEAARPWAMNRFDWSAIAPRWIGHYQRVCDSARPA